VAPPVIDDALSEFLQDWRATHAHDPRRTLMQEATK
jgi:hypothetical protein